MSLDQRLGDRQAAIGPPNGWGKFDVPFLPQRDTHGHAVQFYEDDAFLLGELVRFVGSALGAGDAVIVLATRPHREGLAERLAASGLDLALVTRQGRYVALDAAETLAKITWDGRLDAERFSELVGSLITRAAAAATSSPARVALFGELVALLYADGKPEAAIRLEQLWNDLAQTHHFQLLCGYPLSYFTRGEDGGPIARICAEHTHVIPTESFTSLMTDGQRLQTVAQLQQKALALETEVEERKRAQQELSERNQELRAAISARDEFLSVAAHELKTPLTSLRAFAQLLLRDARNGAGGPDGGIAPERLATALSVIELQTGKLNQLIMRLLDTAYIESGKLRIDPTSVDLAALVRAVLARQSASPRHQLVYDGPEQLTALVDPLRFEQVVANLLDNAVRFSPQGGTVTARLRQDDDGIQLSVSDEGIGIPTEQRERVFERFHQVPGRQHLMGMGLGLYISREIVELHGGSVWIEERNAPGTCVVVTLPFPLGDSQAGPVA